MLVTENGELANPGIEIAAGRIAAVGFATASRRSPARRSVPHIDATGKYILPGVIDAHVHLRQPGLTYKEDYANGTSAAALGGVTCVLDMPNTEPPTNTATRLLDKVASVAGSAWTDYGMYGLISSGDLPHVSDMAHAGVIGFKTFLGQSEQGAGCPLPPGDGELYEAMVRLGYLRIRLAVHAENHGILQWRMSELRVAGADGLAAHRHSRPPVVEVEAIHRVGTFAEYAGCPVHIVHVSSGDGAMAVRAVRARGVDMTAETCPHYLLLDGDRPLTDMRRRVNPPVRGQDDAGALRDAIADGHIQIIASDHAPHSAAEKTEASIWAVRPGVPGTQHLLQLLLANRKALGLTLPDIARVTAAAPARAWGLWPSKGSLVVGADADLALVDLDLSWTIDAASTHSKSGYSPYLGWSGTGKTVTTILRGAVVVDQGKLVGSPAGEWIPGRSPLSGHGRVGASK